MPETFGKFRKLSESFRWYLKRGNVREISIFFTKKKLEWSGKKYEIFENFELWLLFFEVRTDKSSKLQKIRNFLFVQQFSNNDQKNFSRYFGTFYIIWKVSESFRSFWIFPKFYIEKYFPKVSESFRPFQTFREFYITGGCIWIPPKKLQ